MREITKGRDTTACTLTWMFYLLCLHPDLQKEIQEEIDQKLPASQPMGAAELAHGNVPKLHALLYETLRLYPPVPFDDKVCMEDDELPDGSKIPKGTHMAFVPYSQGRDPELWKNPEKVDLSRRIPFKVPSPCDFPDFQAPASVWAWTWLFSRPSWQQPPCFGSTASRLPPGRRRKSRTA
mmetsp:Transcript_16160/g.36995  ORF Transcript_16160/g.36995 Transcript_16160/m.36995 type:complete len:180 (+) Transcript_16160:50-589(+)